MGSAWLAFCSVISLTASGGSVTLFGVASYLFAGGNSFWYFCGLMALSGYQGSAAWFAAYSISIFFLLRAAGRFLGAWVLTRFSWAGVLALFAGLILACFAASVAGGVVWAVYLLPLSGLFMSVMYPTINSKGISCLPKAEHGAAAGVILFSRVFRR